MKPFRSLRLRITLLCALLLTLCCAALAVTSNLSAIHLTDTIAAAPLSPALDPEAAAKGTMPLLTTQAAPVVQQAQQLFQIQSILASTVILAAGLLLIYLLVGRALAPLKDLNDQIQGRTAKDLDQPLSIPDRGDEVTQLAHSFDDLSQRLSRAFLMQRSFSQNAAHEFRTPLAVLKTRIGLFRKKQDFAPQTTEAFLSIMESEVDRLSGMVDSLLKLTNLEQVPRSDRIKLGELLHQAAEDVSPLAAKKGIAILVEASPGTITGSRELLRRALFNLVENAVKYGADGGHVVLAASFQERNVLIRVEDDGPGIPEEHREKIFEPFYRVDKSRSRAMGGAGLGLPMTRAILERHGGTIWLEERPGGGCCFCAALPTGKWDGCPGSAGEPRTKGVV